MATLYISGTVSYSDLKVGDIIGSNVKIVNPDYSPENPTYKYIHSIANRWGEYGEIRDWNLNYSFNETCFIDAEAK
jgi:hypothetical protein